MPDRPESSTTLNQPDASASHAMLSEVQQHKSYLQTGVDSVLDFTIGSNSTVGKEISRYAPTFLQTAALFTPGRGALAASIALGASNEMRVGDSMEMQIAELGMGAAKGAATKAIFNKVGNANIMGGGLWSVPARGVILGASTRAIDIGLTPQTWLSNVGGFDPVMGATRTLQGSIGNPTAIALDAAIFSVAHGATFGANKLASGAIDRSPALRNIVMGSTFGVTSGSTQELVRQQQQGGPLNWGEIAKRGLIEGVVDGVASAPGAVMGDRAARKFVSENFDKSESVRKTTGLAALIGLLSLSSGSGNHSTVSESKSTSSDAPSVPLEGTQRAAADLANGHNIRLVDMTPAERQVIGTENAIVRGSGTVDVKGNSDLLLEVPEGETLRVVLKGGQPIIHISDASKGTVEYVNQAEKLHMPEGLKALDGSIRPDVRVLSPLADVFNPAQIADIKSIQEQHVQVQNRLPETTEAERAQIAKDVYKPAKVQGGVFIIVAGPPGAGKTTNVIDPMAEKHGATVIDGDAINPLIKGYENGWGQVAVGPISADIRTRVLKQAMENRDNIVFPFLGRQLPLMEQMIADARAMGYEHVAVHYVGVPEEVSAMRVYNRAMMPPDKNGIRQVVDAEWALRRVGDGPLRVFEDISQRPGYIDEFVHYNGDVPFGQPLPVVRRSTTSIPPGGTPIPTDASSGNK